MQVKKIITTGTFVILATAVYSVQKLPNIEQFKDKTNMSSPDTSFVEGFDGDVSNWKMAKGAKIEKTAGRNGTSALFYERTNPKAYGMISHKLKLKPGSVYTASVWVRTLNLKSHTKNKNFGGMCIEYTKNSKWYGGTYPQNRVSSSEWRKLSFSFTAKKDADNAKIVLYMRKGFTGKIWFDDFKIESSGNTFASILMTRPSCQTIWDADANVTFQTVSVSNKIKIASSLSLLVNVDSKSRKITKLLKLKKDFSACGDFGKFKSGDVLFTVKLLDMKAKHILGQAVFKLNSRQKSTPPAGACFIDKYNRAVVDGKVFMPIGLYSGAIKENDMKKISDAGFNSLILYSSMYLKIGKNNDNLAGLNKSLDILNNYKLKLIFSLKDQYPWKSWARKKIGDVSGIDNVTTKVVTTLKNHPAILAWYMSDEETSSRIPELIKVRNMVNRLDPYHPTYSLTFRFEDIPFYARTGDIIGVDVYPIKNDSSSSMEKISKGMDAVNKTHKPVWFVPQAFNWGVYKAKNQKDFKQNFRFPTETEIRAMTFLPAICGAKGFIFYHYGDIMYRAEKLAPGSSKKEWTKLCRVVKELKELETFIMSIEKAPAVTVKNEKSNKVQARAFKNNHGELRVLVTGSGPGVNKALIIVKGKKQLKSKYGFCKSLGNGHYQFTGKNICADILY